MFQQKDLSKKKFIFLHIQKTYVKFYISIFFIYIIKIPDKKLDDMTMKKYEKLRENILLMQQLNGKRVEKLDEETPGPGHYNPSHNLVEDQGYAVNITIS